MYLVMELLASVEPLLFFGIASGVLSTIAYVPYIADTIARRTQPQRASWLIWSVLGSIAFVSQVFEGASASLWFAGVQIAGTLVVFILSIWAGKGRYLSKSDYSILLAAGAGLMLWYLTADAAYALAITISISLLGGVATVLKAYRDPESETLITWVFSLIASVCAMISVGALDLTLLAYPLYLFTLYLAFIIAILFGRARHAATENDMPTSIQPVSLEWFFSGLRNTAGAVVACFAFVVAFVVAFNWLGASSSAIDGSPSGHSVSHSVLPLVGATRSGVLMLTAPGAAPVAIVPDANPDSDRGPQASGLVRFRGENDVKRGQVPLVSLPGSAHAAIAMKAEPNTQRNAAGSVLTGSVPMTSPPSVVAVAPILPTPEVMHAPAADAEQLIQHNAFQHNAFQHNTLPADYLRLDADDPFARLVVVDDTMLRFTRPGLHAVDRAVHLTAGSGLTGVRLFRGQRLLALATNGEWFKVSIEGGMQGYMHRSQVVEEALAALASNKSG